jgi:hypothetical protein
LRVSSLDRASQSALEHSLTALLAGLQRRNDRSGFGVCQTCRFFRRRGAEGEPGGPHRCGLTQEALSDADSKLVRAGHEAAEEAPAALPDVLHRTVNRRMKLGAGVTRSPRLPKASSPKNRSGLSVLEDLSDERFIHQYFSR